ncbi:hypothetical protein HN388_06000 [bacterium]|jgi:hypothetical protein|nr:hypothetical protein [bacterium]MBT4292110.1 hypothetical protein [bacterium]
MSAKRNWFIGCGVGCATVILVLVIGGAIIGNMFKDKFSGYEDVEDMQCQLTDRYGEVEDYCPPADGVITSDRINIFLAIQDSLSVPGAILAEQWQTLEDADSSDDKSFGDVVDLAKSAIGFAATIGDYMAARNSAQLSLDMSPGEYIYIYVITYKSWLNLESAGGLEEMDFESDVVHYSSVTSDDLILQLECQLGQLSESDLLYVELAKEIESMKKDSSHTPWQGGLPSEMLTVLEPYRYDLESSYKQSAAMLGIGLRTEIDDDKFKFEVK